MTTVATPSRPELVEVPLKDDFGFKLSHIINLFELDKGLWKMQKKVLLSDAQVVVITGAIQYGKSFIASLKMVLQIMKDMTHPDLKMRAEPGAEYWLVSKEYRGTKGEKLHLERFLRKLGWFGGVVGDTRKGWFIRINCCPIPECQADERSCDHEKPVITTVPTDSPEKIASTTPRAVIICEASRVPEGVYPILLSRITTQNAWMLIVGTSDLASGWLAELVRSIKAGGKKDHMLILGKTSDNLAQYPLGAEDPKFKIAMENMSEDDIQKLLMGEIAHASDLVHPEFNEKYNVKPLEIDFDIGTVYISFDPGYAEHSAYAVLFIQAKEMPGGYLQYRVFDEIYVNLTPGSKVIEEAMRKTWWYDKRINKVLTGDVNSSRRSESTEYYQPNSQQEAWAQLAGLRMRAQKVPIADQINKVSQNLILVPALKAPLIVIDPKCEGLLSEFGVRPSPLTERSAYYSWRLGTDGKTMGKIPTDANNHSIKALAYALVNISGYKAPQGGGSYAGSGNKPEQVVWDVYE